MVSRLTVVTACIVLAYAGLVFHLYQLQLLNGYYYVARADAQHTASDVVKAERGTIYFTDRNGTALPGVMSKDFPLIYAVPKELEDPRASAEQLSPLIGTPASALVKQLAKKNDAYELLLRKANNETAAAVQGLGMKGVYVTDSPERFYPFGKLASHLLGFVGPNSSDAGESGHYGAEEFYDAKLATENVNLTVDPTIQTEAERVLTNLLTNHRARGGSVIVEDPTTGKILAMTSSPDFDPNAYSSAKLSDFMNPITQAIYEPGSVMKVVTMAIGIERGAITPETTFFDTGVLNLNGRKIQNWDLKGHGTVTMTNVIEQSINTGAAFAERKIGDKAFRSYLGKFGFEEKTNIDLPGEIKGDTRTLYVRGAPSVAFATASYGQGIAVTPIEMLQAIAAIANGGVLMRPYVNAELAPKEVHRVIEKATADAVTRMMVSAVDKAEIASVKGYSLAGKTGTALVPDFKHGGYTGNVIDTYIGFGPTSDPRFIIMIKLNEPEGAPHAAETVVPAFHDLAQFILNYYNVPPDRLGR